MRSRAFLSVPVSSLDCGHGLEFPCTVNGAARSRHRAAHDCGPPPNDVGDPIADHPEVGSNDVEEVMSLDTAGELRAEVLRPREAARYVGVSRPTIDRWRKAGKFPKALQLGAQSIGWRRGDLDEWLNNRPVV